MKGKHQTIFGGEKGNCLQAAVASIMELPLDNIPNFAESANMWFALEKFLSHYGLFPLLIRVDPNQVYAADVYYLVIGKSRRGLRHTVVAINGTIVFDPHPDGDGLVTEENVILFVVKDPSRFMVRGK